MRESMEGIKKSSFRKRGVLKENTIKGTKPSLHNSQLLISSGISSFDAFIGGGFPVGSLVLINEDEHGIYSKFLLRYFLAEGIVSNHACFFCSQDVDPKEMAQHIPCAIDGEIEEEEKEAEMNDKKMTIAWRYENLKAVPSSPYSHSHFGHHFDLSKKIDNKTLKNSDMEFWSGFYENSGDSFQNTSYWHLLKSIQKKLSEGKFFAIQKSSERNILRIVLHSLHSPLWQYDFETQPDKNCTYFSIFLYTLRSLIRNAYATCVITLPFSKYQKSHIDKCIHLSDIAIQLQSFVGTKFENMAPYKDYHGFFLIQKLAAINGLVSFNPGVTNLAFKLRRRKLVIEEFHLPPELEDSTEREQDDSAVLSCSSIKSSKLEF